MKKYRTIVVDPPWNYGDLMSSGQGRVRGAGNHYDLLSQEDLMRLPMGEWADDEAHLYLWTTNAFVRDAFALVEAWGFEYKTMLIWGKPQIGMGHYFRNNTEPILFATKGNMKTLRKDVPTLFMAPRGRHSEKPAAFYDMVETMSPEPRLDVFARLHRFGWDVYGNEVYTDIPLVEKGEINV